MLDEKDPENDRKIAERVIMNHRYQGPQSEMQHFNYANDEVIIEPIHKEEKDKDGGKAAIVFEKINQMINGKLKQPVTRDFLKKYISFAKSQKSPEINQDCIEYAAQFYAALRHKAQKYD